MKLKGTSWFFDTPKRAINQAYQAALKIKAIEDRYFSDRVANFELVKEGSRAKNSDSFEYNDRVVNYLQGEIKKYLKIVKIRLREFKVSSALLNFIGISLAKSETDRLPFYLDDRAQSNFIEQFELIDLILTKYDRPFSQYETKDITPPSKDITPPSSIAKLDTVSDKTSFLPRSFLRTIDRIKDDISPQSSEKEVDIVRNYRQSRQKTIISVRFFLTLIVVPFLTYQITKTFLVKPIVASHFFLSDRTLFLNQDLEEEAFEELQHFEYKLYFRSLIGTAPEITTTERESKIKAKVAEIVEEYRQQSIDAISNIFADLFSLLSFTLVLFLSQREIVIFKSFLDNLIYGLSDSAKAFMIILITDIFVGYHSTHGWEIILENLARHFGLPENREFIFLFIATFPVILDTMFKYWIFRYLNRISPSSVATYREMNE